MPKILAVDDSATMRRIYEMTFVGQEGYEVVAVETGDQALRGAGGADLVLADASMSPAGYDLARSLRDGGFAGPIVLLASQHSPFDAERARASGIDDHILKPFDTQSLIDKARDVIARGRGSARPVAAAPARPVAAAPAAPPVAAPRPAPAPVAAAPAAPAAPVGGAVQAARPAVARATASFGAPMGAKPPMAVPTSAIVGAPAPRPAAPAAPTPAAAKPAPAAAATHAAMGEMAGKLAGMGLTPEQVNGILALSREVVERVVWEVVPDIAERVVREEIKRLTS